MVITCEITALLSTGIVAIIPQWTSYLRQLINLRIFFVFKKYTRVLSHHNDPIKYPIIMRTKSIYLLVKYPPPLLLSSSPPTLSQPSWLWILTTTKRFILVQISMKKNLLKNQWADIDFFVPAFIDFLINLAKSHQRSFCLYQKSGVRAQVQPCIVWNQTLNLQSF